MTRTEIVKADKPELTAEAVARGAAVLRGDGLVAFATETVYGLGAIATHPKALAKLAAVKERPGSKPFTLHIGSRERLEWYVPEVGLRDRVLLQKAWPGPLTVVFELSERQRQTIDELYGAEVVQALYADGTIGVRCPDHAVAGALLDAVEEPVVAPSANLAGKQPPREAADVVKQLDGKIELVLDSGPTRYGEPSTVIRLRDDEMEILREGVLDGEALERLRRVTFLFICTGNSCRSPMAEGLCRKHLAQKLSCRVDHLGEKGYKAMSAGVAAYQGAQASPEAIQACAELDVDIRGHRSQPLTLELLHKADFVYGMSESHVQTARRLAPDMARKIRMLDEERPIADPIGMTVETYRRCAAHIEEALEKRVQELMD